MEEIASPENGLEPSTALAQPTRRFYTVGFLFSEADNVILMEKKRPAWQAGRYNGIGGKIERNERPVDAMRRESVEEIGVDPDWSDVLCIEYTEHVLHIFASRDETAFYEARAQTDERIVRVNVAQLITMEEALIPNLQWLIPLARHHLFFERIALAHVMFRGGGATIARKL